MLGLFRRNKHKEEIDYTFLNAALIAERTHIRDTDLKLLRSTITKRRKEVGDMLKVKVITEAEYQRQLDTLDVIEKHALDVVLLRNRERMTSLGAPKKQRNGLHKVEM